jgi:MoxR-like ATPase
MMTKDVRDLNAAVREENKIFQSVIHEIRKVVIGQQQLVDRLLIALIMGGHILLEGVPGLAKTLIIKTLSQAIQCEFKRIQFTPDLLPADLTGTSIYNPKEGTFSIERGPLFTNIVLADEINRAPPKVQSALLEVMQEHQVTIGKETYKTGNPFFVLATQNPIEQEGTYPLPEAQTDRFMMKVIVTYPSKQEEMEIIDRMGRGIRPEKVNAVISGDEILKARAIAEEIYLDDKVAHYILDIIQATRYPDKFGIKIDHLLQFGASPRATLNFIAAAKGHAFLEGRGFVTPHDVKSVAHDVLRHRLRRTYEAEAEDISSDQIIDKILNSLLVP